MLSPAANRQLEAEAWEEAKRLASQGTDRHALFQQEYWDKPHKFASECLTFRGDGPTPYQLEILEQLPKCKRVAVRGPHGLGKCVDWEDDVQLADGQWVPAGQMVGRCAEVPAVGPGLEPTIAGALFADNGKREVVEVTTKRGRVIRRTLNHPLWADPDPYRWDDVVFAKRLRPEGQWVSAGNLKPGDVVAIASSSVPYQAQPQPIENVKLAAYLLGDGGLTSGGARFTNTDPDMMGEFQDVCQKLGCRTVPMTGDPITVNINAAIDSPRVGGHPYNRVLDLLGKWGMRGIGSHDKRFPSWVWSLPRSQLSIFLSRLYACDGWACTSVSRGRQIGYATVSPGLARDVSRALLRLGISANLLKKRTRWIHKGIEKKGTCFQLTIDDVQGCIVFAEHIGIFAKDDAVGAVVESALSADPHRTQKWQAHKLPSGYLWEKVDKVKRIGRRPTVAITVPGVETFTTEFVEHNTAMSAWAVLWFALTRDGRDWKIPMTASAWRQLSKFLLPEIHKWVRRIKWNKVQREPFNERLEVLSLSLKLSTGEAFALASNDVNAIEGAHATHLLYVFDEAKAIPDDIWDGAEGAFASSEVGESLGLAISTPGAPVGRFYDIHSRQAGTEDWWTRHVRLEEAVEAGRIGLEWADQRKRQWGEKSAVYQNRVLGEFATSEEDGVIALALVEAANQRWQEWADAGKSLEGPMDVVAVDVARTGEDQTAYALLYGDIVTSIRRTSQEDTMKTTGRTVGILRNGGTAIVDVIGIGAGVVDRLREMKQPVKAFNASRRSSKLDRSKELRFANLRAEAWWNLREMLEDGECALPPDDLLTGDLTAPRWFVQSGGRIQIESKDDLRKEKRLGRSTDTGDAVVMAYWKPAGGVLRY